MKRDSGDGEEWIYIRQLFLYGGRADNFESTSKSFIEAAGGLTARIALLFSTGADGWDRNLAWYRDPWFQLGVSEVIPVHPVGATSVLSEEALANLERSTGIFMCGGDTRQYHRVYAQGVAKEIIGRAYQSGVPYGGLSAGALITPHICSIWGDRLTTRLNYLCLRGSEDGCQEELQLGPGLGFLNDVILETHFSERGGFPRLIAAMAEAGVPFGVGFDNPILVHFKDESILRVEGRGRAYILRRKGINLEIRVVEPGEELSGTGMGG